MPAFTRAAIALAVALSLAACAAPPPAKRLDAKSQLEMNR